MHTHNAHANNVRIWMAHASDGWIGARGGLHADSPRTSRSLG